MVGTPFPVSLAGRACEECKIESTSGLLTLSDSPTQATSPVLRALGRDLPPLVLQEGLSSGARMSWPENPHPTESCHCLQSA